MSKIHLKFFILLILVISFLPGFATGNTPVPIDSVDYKRIEHKKVRMLIRKQKHFGIKTFSDMNPVCFNTTDSDRYHTFSKSLLIRQDIDAVWDNLIQLAPQDEFNGSIAKFALLYSKNQNNILYSTDVKKGIEEGQILFFNLCVLGGIRNLAVALEVTCLDKNRKTVEYCYIDHGNTKGTQQIILTSTPEGYTIITQHTLYRCNFRMRNNRIYAFFHERIVNDLFHNIQKKCDGGTDGFVGNEEEFNHSLTED